MRKEKIDALVDKEINSRISEMASGCIPNLQQLIGKDIVVLYDSGTWMKMGTVGTLYRDDQGEYELLIRRGVEHIEGRFIRRDEWMNLSYIQDSMYVLSSHNSSDCFIYYKYFSSNSKSGISPSHKIYPEYKKRDAFLKKHLKY